MLLSIIIPVHNEKRFIEETIARVFSAPIPIEKEVIVVDDGSNDGTMEPLNALRRKFKIKILRHKNNLGKGAAVRTGIENASGELILIQDADLEYSPADYPTLLSAMKENVGAVFGNRGAKHWPKNGFHYVVGAKILSWTFSVLFWRKINDLYTGYKLIRTSALRDIKLAGNGFEFEAEVSCKLVKKGVKIVEVPISYSPRNKDQGKHIGWRDAFVGFWTIIKCRLFS